jgi:hypothetical protein
MTSIKKGSQAMRRSHGKALVLAAVSMLLISASATHARQVRRIEHIHSTVSFCDQQHQFSIVCADLTLGENSSELDITLNDGIYNSRLSTRCEDNTLVVSTDTHVTGTAAGDVVHTCGILDPIRIEGAIDAL